jgi:hypothetical protein
VDGFCVHNLSALTRSPLRWPGSADINVVTIYTYVRIVFRYVGHLFRESARPFVPYGRSSEAKQRSICRSKRTR